MRDILQDLPFFRTNTTLIVPGVGPVTIKDHQIVVWVSLAPRGQPSLPVNSRRFPAILDTGCTHSFYIQQQHLVDWAGFAPSSLKTMGAVRRSGMPQPKLPVLACNVWLYPNLPHERDKLSGPPFCLTTNGIVLSPPFMRNNPRLPLLGLRALVINKLRLYVNGDSLRSSIVGP